jgi:predicted transcriptional regulator
MPILKLEDVLESKGWDTRKKILCELSKGPHTAYSLAKKLSLNYSTVRYHLELLEKFGLVRSDKSSKYLYVITQNGLNLLKLYISR